VKRPPVPPPLDQPALERLYTELEKPLYNVVYRWVWDREEARDLVQEAFVRLWRARARVEPETARPFVYRIALNLASRRRRWRRLWGMVTESALGGRSAAGPAPDQALSDHQQERRLRAAVEALSEPLRRVILLCELGELSYAEVARVLNVPPGTVGSRRNAAMGRLKQALEGS
jgi:RNA polymerase sigma-70 factor (ECF subfamily)